MRCKVKLDHYIFKTKMEDERYESLRKIIPALAATQPIEDFYWTTHEADIVALAKAQFKFEVEAGAGPIPSDFAVTLYQRIEDLEKTITGSSSLGRVINLTINGESSWLNQINDVEVLEDCCTDQLRNNLNEGWRIVAVCQQKGTRRPDYVLGRIKETV